MFLFQQQAEDSVTRFDLDLIWNSLYGLLNFVSLPTPLPDLCSHRFHHVFVVARIVRGAIDAAGRRTRFDVTLADLLGRLASFLIAILGILWAL
ncbi:MAG TPA: hypothetical protein VFZ23_02640 [Pyrinomonadaceae bacterium]